MVEVVGARQSRSGRGRRGSWSMWSELGGAAQDVIDVVCGRSSVVEVVEASSLGDVILMPLDGRDVMSGWY